MPARRPWSAAKSTRPWARRAVTPLVNTADTAVKVAGAARSCLLPAKGPCTAALSTRPPARRAVPPVVNTTDAAVKTPGNGKARRYHRQGITEPARRVLLPGKEPRPPPEREPRKRPGCGRNGKEANQPARPCKHRQGGISRFESFCSRLHKDYLKKMLSRENGSTNRFLCSALPAKRPPRRGRHPLPAWPGTFAYKI